MSYGIRLSGTDRDLAALHALAAESDALVDAAWTALTPPAPSRASVITSAALDTATVRRLLALGLDVVRVTRGAGGVALTGARGAPDERYAPCASRAARNLAEAVRPVRAAGDPACPEALFVAVGAGAQRTLERLLALGRDDVTVADVTLADGGAAVVVRVTAPPMYLLLRSREEPDEGVTAFARAGSGEVWVEWSWSHPLAHAGEVSGRVALVTRDGAWRFAPAGLPLRSVHDAIAPRFDAPRHDLAAAPGETRFTIRLRLAPAPPTEPALWLLDPEQFLALEALIESLAPDELARLTVARCVAPAGTRYVLREHVRAGQARLGARVSDLVGAGGFARVAGTENLYLPPGRQLVPRMRRDVLDSLLALDGAALVAVAEDHDGPCVFRAPSLDEQPLARWVDFVATDRRVELDRLAETAVFEWPELAVEAPPRPAEEAPGAVERPRPPPLRPEAPPAETAPAAAVVSESTPEDPASSAHAALRAEALALESTLAAGGVAEATPWRELGWRKERLGELDDAAACAEAEMFFEGPTAARCEALAAWRGRHLALADTPDAWTAVASREHWTPGEAGWLAARVLAGSLRNDPSLDDGIYREAARRFADPETPVSRRLAWTVCRALHARTGDRLGLTRAREQILGAIDERGLSDAHDVPRFVRLALARQVDGGVDAALERLEQVAALESLVAASPAASARGLDSLPSYLAAVFAAGFGRLGASERAAELAAEVQAALPGFEAPNRVLLKLYLTRAAHSAAGVDDEGWRQAVAAALGALTEPRVRDRVEWLRKRSEWLRTGAIDAVGAAAKPSVERALAAAEAQPERALDALGLMDDRTLFDFEVRIVGQRLLRVGLRSGNDELLGALLRATQPRLGRLSHPGHRAELIGECLRAAAVLRDGPGVDGLLDAVVTLTRASDGPATRDLLQAVTPGLAALRRLGAGEAARRFLEALVPAAARGQREGIRLRAALAEGFLLLRDGGRADGLIDEALDDVLGEGLDPVGRHEAGAAVLAALRHWPVPARLPRCRRLFEALGRFTDAFTASTQRVYETHKILLAERVVDALADARTVADDRARAWLAEEEQATRRRVLNDWREACGR